jgi:hypothetical protein
MSYNVASYEISAPPVSDAFYGAVSSQREDVIRELLLEGQAAGVVARSAAVAKAGSLANLIEANAGALSLKFGALNVSGTPVSGTPRQQILGNIAQLNRDGLPTENLSRQAFGRKSVGASSRSKASQQTLNNEPRPAWVM